MSLQWTLVAGFLYVEIAVVLLLLLPFISATRWNKIFKSRIVAALSTFSTIYFRGNHVLLLERISLVYGGHMQEFIQMNTKYFGLTLETIIQWRE